ncbi:hypothetical protein [Candidatus Nitrosotalea bavarica]|uniref:hypothetical protein n=1 Tax=Candidatus Nitrosotalea bavarica TaxID=1903277 RepID=UPI001FECDF6D|nr:hypothetical protein [Candidatus Nitrosotalea bavarica]
MSLNQGKYHDFAMTPQPVLSIISVALFVIGLVGNGFEMRKIRLSTAEGQLVPKNAFLDKRNFKWYALIGIALVLWAINGSYT